MISGTAGNTERLHSADARFIPLADECVQTCITSPPYFGLRDYGTGTWVGGETSCDHRQEAPRFNGPKQTTAQVSDKRTAGIDGGRGDHSGRNLRNWWEVVSEPTPEAHFATFGTKWITPAILAGTSEKGCCAECGAPWARVTTTSYDNPGNRTTNGPRSLANRYQTEGFAQRLEKRVETTGWRPSCSCNAPVRPCLVLDPFGGSGTTSMMCNRLGRRSVCLELSPDYIEISRRRTAQLGLGL